MRTLIVSDLHLGSRKHGDLLRRAEQREVLFAALEDVERLVLLGDVLELRHGPSREALAAARPFFEDLGRRFAGREVVLLAGNHDYALVAPWLERRREGPPEALGLEERAAAHEVSPAVEKLAEWAASARLTVAHPGTWVREDVYATHGHYLDVRLTLPTFERIASGVVARLLGCQATPPSSAEGYEARLAPLYAWVDAMAQQAPTGRMLDGSGTVGAWRMVSGRGPRRVLSLAAAAAFPLGVALLNRIGLGPLRAEVSGDELRRGALRAMGETVDSLGIDAAHVVFGHTHRAGPLPGDPWHEWGTSAGTRLLNSGSWIFETHFMSGVGAASPYWPGGCVIVEDYGPPRLERLLTAGPEPRLGDGEVLAGAGGAPRPRAGTGSAGGSVRPGPG